MAPSRSTPLDTLNGVFRKADAPVELVDGMTILVGREVLRYERVEAEERTVHPLVRHGVALFGSPPREPWGRLVQLVPSGGYRDVRHLIATRSCSAARRATSCFATTRSCRAATRR